MGIFRKPIDKLPHKGAGMSGKYGKHLRKKYFMGIVSNIFKMGIIVGIILLLISMIIIIQIMNQLPDVDVISTYVPNETTKVYSRDGLLLAELHREENRALVPISKISDYIKAAVIASEDNNFYEHYGIDPKGIVRAAFVNLTHGAAVQGASTITQQLARNVFLNKRKKVVRKLAEVILALQLERRYTKEEILEFYLNQVYWGHNAYGIESAANLYFDKKANELNLAESAMLIGILRGPELYSPFRNPKKARWRKELVLGQMISLGIISEEEYYEAKEMPTNLASRKKLKYKAPYFTSYVVKQLESMYGSDVIYNSGLKVYTTLDYELQKKGEDTVSHFMSYAQQSQWVKGEMVSSLNCTQASILSIDPSTGYIVIWVGGRDFLEREFDHIVQAKRQPGSSFKPYTYLTALNMGMSPGTVINDKPVTFNTIEGPYAPQNYSRKFRGPLTLRRALELSINVVAIKVSDLIDPSNIIVTCRKLGITSPLQPILSLTLGANEVSVLEHASAFCVIANGGVRVDPVSILKIEDRNGTVLYQHEIVEKRVYDANKIYALIDMMKGVILRGTGRGAYIPGYDIAGKTGTTSDYRDAWFIGFTPDLLTACWVGNDDNAPMINVTGGWIPAQMWQMYMVRALKKIGKRSRFPYPRGMIRQKICMEGKGLAIPLCHKDKVVEELMWTDGKYTKNCQVHSVFSGITGILSGSRPDWEKTFYANEGAIEYIEIAQEEEPMENVTENIEEEPKKEKPKLNYYRGL